VGWQQILRLLEDPALIRAEIDRRLQALQDSAPRQRQEAVLRLESHRLRTRIAQLLEAYQEGLLSLEELRQRMPDLHRREQALQAELHSLADPAGDQQAYLRLADTVESFLAR
jgi:site-specific DNA recombinase